MTCGKGPLPTLGEDRALLMPIRGGNEARFRRKCIADHAPPLPDEVARGVHGSFTGESGRGARFGAIGRSFTGKVALGRCGEHFATALAGAGSPRRAGGRGLSRLVSAQATRSGRRGADPGLRRAKRVRPGLGSPDDPPSMCGSERLLGGSPSTAYAAAARFLAVMAKNTRPITTQTPRHT